MLATAKDATSAQGWSSGRALGLLLVTAGYYVGGVIAIWLMFRPDNISAIWLPHGVLLAAFVLIPPRQWWLYVVVLLPAHLHLVRTFQGPVPLGIMFIQFGGNIAQAALAAAVLRPIVRSKGRDVLSGM